MSIEGQGHFLTLAQGCVHTKFKPDFQPQKMARGLKFWVEEVEGFCRENKGDDQLCGYSAADLPLCFAYAKSRFSYEEPLVVQIITLFNRSFVVTLRQTSSHVEVFM